MIIGPWEWDDKHLLSFRGVKCKKKKKNETLECVCVCVEGGGEKASHINDYTYLLGLDTSHGDGEDTPHSQTLSVLSHPNQIFTNVVDFFFFLKRLKIWIYSFSTAGPRRGHGSDCGSSGSGSGVHRLGDAGGVPAQPLLEDVHRRRERHHHLHHLWKPVDVVCDGFDGGS